MKIIGIGFMRNATFASPNGIHQTSALSLSPGLIIRTFAPGHAHDISFTFPFDFSQPRDYILKQLSPVIDYFQVM
jgi:hypothetical protein